jgi:predicted nucleic acid-binding protein
VKRHPLSTMKSCTDKVATADFHRYRCFAINVQSDINHKAADVLATRIRQGEFGQVVTTNYIIDELITFVRSIVNHQAAVEIYESINNSPNIRIFPVTDNLRKTAFKIFCQNPDKTYSFTDCVSFATMKSLNITTAFSFDFHFKQAGFHGLP